jgi:hypothetical protein
MQLQLNVIPLVKQILLISLALIATSCNNQTERNTVIEADHTLKDSTTKTYVDSLQQLEEESTILNYDSLGDLTFTIKFEIKTNNFKDYENGKIPWIRIDSPQLNLKDLIRKDEIVIPESRITIIIDYPLTTNYKFDLVSEKGFSRTQLINEISNHYYQLYIDEEKTATIKTIPMQKRKIFNRNQTNGKYGIWGHDIGDLILTKAHVDKRNDGKIFLTLELES